jgi:hypothetical protein
VVRRWSQWEFWPTWAAYAPVVPWIAWLACHHGGLQSITAANPGLADGGLVGESKFDILRVLPLEVTVPTALIAPGPADERLRATLAFGSTLEQPFPLILKPDVGQRGVGVRRLGDRRSLAEYLARAPYALVAQPWHPGPFEAGIFYARLPDEDRGRILSITDKVFPVVVGDGRRTLRQLILQHPRYAIQRAVFLARHAARLDEVIPDGERCALGVIGNHSQGTLFRDGSHLITVELERAIDEIARQIPEFHIGRFDVRYGDPAAFARGEGFRILELNGVTAEPTDIYDPSRPIASAYRALFEQWRLIFVIGAANRRRGHRGATAARLAALGWEHLWDRRTFPTAG